MGQHLAPFSRNILKFTPTPSLRPSTLSVQYHETQYTRGSSLRLNKTKKKRRERNNNNDNGENKKNISTNNNNDNNKNNNDKRIIKTERLNTN